MKASLRKGAASVSASATTSPAIRKWSDRDHPIPATRGKAKPDAKQSIHFKILSRTGGK